MNLLFDIFEKENDDRVVWRAAAATMEEAKAHVRKFAMSSPGEYVILSLRTGHKLVVKTVGVGGTGGSDAQFERKLHNER
jgi:hypothetical protein